MTTVPNQVILRDSGANCWLRFDQPLEIVEAHSCEDVLTCLRYLEDSVQRHGLYAAGMISYEAAPAFDSSLVVQADGRFPLLWFGLYRQPVKLDSLPCGSTGNPPDITLLQSVSPEEYRCCFEQIKDHISCGDTYQVNYTFRMRGSSPAAYEAHFERLLASQSPPFGAIVHTDRWSVYSASPEMFFSLEGTVLQSRPMKGTAARGLTWEDDCRQGAALQRSEKDKAENLMIVDMVRNDLGRIADTGTVAVTSLFDLEKYRTSWQLTSSVTAHANASVTEIFTAMFPPASITGAPKKQAMETIARLENAPRRIYTGSIGFIAPGRHAQFNVAIRSLLVDRENKSFEYGTGGGIVWDSHCESELAECRTKARIFAATTGDFSILETLLWTPDGHYRLLEHHLTRMEQSAAYFNYPFTQHSIRQHLTHLSRGFAPLPHKVRVLLDRDGGITSQADVLIPDAGGVTKQVALARFPVDKPNPFLYHKTTHRQIYRDALAACEGYDNVILHNEDGEVTESVTANVVVDLDGILYTPPIHCGLLAGTYRAWLLELKIIQERVISVRELLQAQDVYLINSVRGIHRIKVLKSAG